MEFRIARELPNLWCYRNVCRKKVAALYIRYYKTACMNMGYSILRAVAHMPVE